MVQVKNGGVLYVNGVPQKVAKIPSRALDPPLPPPPPTFPHGATCRLGERVCCSARRACASPPLTPASRHQLSPMPGQEDFAYEKAFYDWGPAKVTDVLVIGTSTAPPTFSLNLFPLHLVATPFLSSSLPPRFLPFSCIFAGREPLCALGPSLAVIEPPRRSLSAGWHSPLPPPPYSQS